MRGASVVVFDNVIHRLDSGDLCKALTETLHADRAFRTHEQIILPVKCTWLATGNNIQLGGDMPRRCYCVGLDAQTSQPHLRDGFQIPDLRTCFLEYLGGLLAALLTLAHAWLVAGSPKPDLTLLGSFERWSVIVGGILQHSGICGFLNNSKGMSRESDPESVQWEGFLLTLKEVFYGEPFTVADLVEKLNAKTANPNDPRKSDPTEQAQHLRAMLPDFLAEFADREGSFQRRTGHCFAERAGRRFGDSRPLERGEVSHKVQEWQVETAAA